jgi:hypothetical protein
MNLIKILKFLYKSKDPHFLSVDKKTYQSWKPLIKLMIKFNTSYKPCEIYRKRYKSMEDFVVVGLKFNGKNVKRRTAGFAKEFVEQNRNSKCLYCGVKLHQENATADHIIPISDGGNNCQVNLVVCCKKCNNERGNIDFKSYYRMKKNIHSDKIYV